MPEKLPSLPQVKIALLEKEVEILKKEHADLEKKLNCLEEERNKALKWGVMTLGSMVISLLVAIFSFAKDHIK